MNTTSDEFSRRKSEHLEICLDHEKYRVKTSDALFEEIHFYHHALPEINREEISLSTRVLDFDARAPLFISCMTGGSEEGYQLNKELAAAAEALRIPVGMGSNRILWKKPDTLPHFEFRKFAPTVPLLSNLGAVQIRDMDHNEIIEMNKRLGVSAQVIHCNPGQELFQPEGDRNFKGITQALYRFIDSSPLPVIIKETGFGFHPREVTDLLEHGAYAVDLAGAGGTNWISVEAYRNHDQELQRSREFDSWGHPTALLLAALKGTPHIWASGGIHSGMDAAKALALGAEMAGLAMGFIEVVKKEGREGVIAYFEQLEKTIIDVMLLSSCRTIAELQASALRYSPSFREQLSEYRKGLARTENE